MFQANYIIIKRENLQCRRRLINQDKELLISLTTILKWKNIIFNRQEIPKWRLCLSDQVVSTSLIQVGTILSCKSSIQAPCMEAINSTRGFQATITSTIRWPPNTLLRVWDFPLKKWTPPALSPKSIIKAQSLHFKQAQIQRAISERPLRKWTRGDLTRVGFRMTLNWSAQALTRMMMAQNYLSLNLLMTSQEINLLKSWREVCKLTCKECKKEKVSM